MFFNDNLFSWYKLNMIDDIPINRLWIYDPIALLDINNFMTTDFDKEHPLF